MLVSMLIGCLFFFKSLSFAAASLPFEHELHCWEGDAEWLTTRLHPNWKEMSYLASVNKLLLLARFVFTLLPLKGYIHPDEFYQSSEIAASDVFGLNIERTWEWQASSPARTIIFPAISSGLPFLLIKFLNSVLGLNISTYILLTTPRLFMAVATYAIDLALGNMAEKVYGCGDTDRQSKIEIVMFLFRSSAVTLVFLTRTFSNVYETILFSLFLWKLISQISKENFSKGCSSSTVMLTVMIIFGFFVRQTFIFFVAFGCVTYAIFCIKNRNFVSQAILALITLLVTGFGIIYLDSLYFSKESKFKFSFTPLNLILYNLDEANLKLHGEHPRYLHVVVNCPLLFGPMILAFTFASYKVLFRGAYTKHVNERMNRGIMSLLVASGWSSVLSLSYFKHQEPRFIIPLITPLCLISAWFLGSYPGIWKRFVHFWIISNSAVITWYGFVHQGGVVPCLSYLSHEIDTTYNTDGYNCIKYDMVFWYTYMAPQHLVSAGKNESSLDIRVHNLGGAPDKKVTDFISNILQRSKIDYTRKCKNEVYLAVPATVKVANLKMSGVHLEQTFFPHISVETPPWNFAEKHMNIFLKLFSTDWRKGILEAQDFWVEMRKVMSLNLYHID